jgi:hypothetical protein
MLRFAACVLGAVLATAPLSFSQDQNYSVKTASAEPPKELDPSISGLLNKNAIQFRDPAGALVCELWLCKEVPADATTDQVKNGITYRELKETQLIGAVRFDQPWYDYRKQKVKAGVYTLRIGFQPPDGDHAGKSPKTEFVLLSSAAKDQSPDLIQVKDLIEMSRKSIESGHPGVLMLFPNNKVGPAEVDTKEQNHVVVNTNCAVTAAGMRGTLGIGLTLVGEASE